MKIAEWLEKNNKFIDLYKTNIDDCQVARTILNDFKESIRGKKIIIYGSGCVGRDFYLLFRELNLSITYVLDKKFDNSDFYKEVEVCNPNILEKITDIDNYILIATVERKTVLEIKEDIEKINSLFKDILNGHDIHMILQSAWCLIKSSSSSEKIVLKNCSECTNLDNTCLALNIYLKRLNNFKTQKLGKTTSVNMIGYLLGNICTLNCKNCCESVPYIDKEKKRFISKDTVIKDIIKLSDACEFLTLLEFIGGETFMHPDLSKIIQSVLKISNIGMIHIFTNGTVIPNETLCKSLQNERINIYLSNYQVSYPANLVDNVKKTIEKFDEYKINYFFGKKQSWLDFSSYELQCTDEHELKNKFPNCFLHNCNRLCDGMLYICPHQYAGMELKKLNKQKNILSIHEYDNNELPKQLELFKSYEYIEACSYCSMPYKAKTVLSGEQIEG